jgi:adenylylsulfate kinase
MAWAVWVTGLPGSGKTTISREIAKCLRANGINVKVLEMDEIRKFITPEPKYSQDERDIVYASIAYMAKILTDENVNVIIDATANLRKYRENAKKLIPGLSEIYIKCPIEVCIARESKRKAGFAPVDIYDKGFKGKSATVPGVNVPYEEPLDPLISIDTEKTDLHEAGKQVAMAIMKRYADGHV